MGNVVRVINGGRIQVRTGVLQGIGPQGPVGPVGPAGPDGPAGPQGETGPAGAITQISAEARVVSGAFSTGTVLLTFPSVQYDDMGILSSSSLFTIPDAGDYLVTVWGDWGSSITGTMTLYSPSDSNAVYSAGPINRYGHLSRVVRGTAGQTFSVNASVSGATTLAAGSITWTRTGSGPQGIQGLTGPTGPQGPTGPAGPTGATGSASGGFATYGDLY